MIDLQVSGLFAVTGDSTGKVMVSWHDLNTGSGPLTQGFNDSLLVQDPLTGVVLDSILVPENSAISAGGFIAQSGSIQLPLGFNSSHPLTITVMADATSDVLETNENNNTATTTNHLDLWRLLPRTCRLRIWR